jgi:hypothetical protein
MIFSRFLNYGSSIFDIKFAQKFIDKYAGSDNWHEIDSKTGSLGYGWIHYGLIRVYRPRRVLCIGSKLGFIPAICALACRDNNYGVVDFVDAGYDQINQDPSHWGGVGLWKRINKDKYFGIFGLSQFINLHVMKSTDYATKYPKRTYGYIHIDGDHSYAGVKKDYSLFYPRLEKAGYCALHDIATQDLGGLDYGVGTFWKELCKKHAWKVEYEGRCGLGIVRKYD